MSWLKQHQQQQGHQQHEEAQ
jgi:hypothetical protein